MLLPNPYKCLRLVITSEWKCPAAMEVITVSFVCAKNALLINDGTCVLGRSRVNLSNPSFHPRINIQHMQGTIHLPVHSNCFQSYKLFQMLPAPTNEIHQQKLPLYPQVFQIYVQDAARTVQMSVLHTVQIDCLPPGVSNTSNCRYKNATLTPH